MTKSECIAIIILFIVVLSIYFLNKYLHKDWSFYDIAMEIQKKLEEEIREGGNLVEYERDKDGFVKYVRFKNLEEENNAKKS